MNKKKIGRYFWVFIILAVLFLFFRVSTLEGIASNIVDFNLKITEENGVGLFFAYWGEILVILIVWDWLALKSNVNISCLLGRISADLLKQNKIRLSILCIRLNFGIRKLIFMLRLGWVRYDFGDNDNIVWNSISRPPIKDVILEILFTITRLPTLIAMFLTAFSLKYFEYNDIRNIVMSFGNFEFDFWDAIKLLSPLTFVVLIVSLGYFISFKGCLRRTIAIANRKKIEDIIQVQRDLVGAIGCSFNSISSNIQYVINCQDLVADLWIHSKYPEYNIKKHSLIREYDIESYCFRDIPELECISQKLDELNSNGNWKATMTFSSYKYEMLTFLAKSNRLDLKKLNEAFFTIKGMKTLINNDRYPVIDITNEEIDKMRLNYLYNLPSKIVDSLELLYMLQRYYDEINKLLDFRSDKVGRALRMLTGKE